MSDRVLPANMLSPFLLSLGRHPNGFLVEDYEKYSPVFNLASIIDNIIAKAVVVGSLQGIRQSHYNHQSMLRDKKIRVSDPLEVGSVVYHHVPKGIKYRLWDGPFIVVGHDERMNHRLQRAVMGKKQDINFSNPKVDVECPLDQLKHIKDLSYKSFEDWTDSNKILEHRINKSGVYTYRVRFAYLHPVFDTWLKEDDFRDATIVKEYNKSLQCKK